MCFTLNYLCPHYYPPLYFSLYLTFFVPLFLFSLSLTRCLLTSCAQMAEKSRQDGFLWSVHTLKHPNRHARKQTCAAYHRVTCYSRDPGLLPQSLKISPCFHFSPHLFTAYDHINMKQMPQTRMWLQTNMGYGQKRSRIWLFLCSNWISAFLCVWLIGKWLDCNFLA